MKAWTTKTKARTLGRDKVKVTTFLLYKGKRQYHLNGATSEKSLKEEAARLNAKGVPPTDLPAPCRADVSKARQAKWDSSQAEVFPAMTMMKASFKPEA